jgi:hypothetical protein
VGEPVAEVIGELRREDLRLIFETPERAGMHNTIAIALKLIAVRVRRFGVPPAPGSPHQKPEMSERGRMHYRCSILIDALS